MSKDYCEKCGPPEPRVAIIVAACYLVGIAIIVSIQHWVFGADAIWKWSAAITLGLASLGPIFNFLCPCDCDSWHT